MRDDARRPEGAAGKQPVTLRIPEPLLAWVEAAARDTGRSVRAVVCELIEDLRGMHGLPRPVVELLHADTEALGLDPRRYVQHLLLRRFELVKRRGPGFDASAKRATRERQQLTRWR